MKIVYMGSADFGIPSLERLIQVHQITGIVSTPAKPKGRGLKVEDSPIVQFAKKHELSPVMTPLKCNDPDFVHTLKLVDADLFVVIAFRILPREIFSLPRFGTVNLHASLLPKYRGPAPIHRAIEAGESETGITIFRIDGGIDTGEILLQEKIPIGNSQTTPELYELMSNRGADLLFSVLNSMENGTIIPIKQDNALAGKAPKLSKGEGRIDWSLPAKCIFNKIRAFKPFPGTYTCIDAQRIGIEWAVPVEGTNMSDYAPGTVATISSDNFIVVCGSGMLRVEKIKPEGKRVMTVHDFLLGSKIEEGTRFS